MSGMVQAVVGAGPHEWVWAAIAAGDLTAVRAAPASFDVAGFHPKYGSVLTAFLQGLLNLEGRFITEPSRARRAAELIDELGRRGARPDAIIPSANIEVKGLYQDWRLTGDVTPMQAVIEMRDGLLKRKFESEALEDGAGEGAGDDGEILNGIIDKFAEIAARSGPAITRALIPEPVVGIWERCLEDGSTADVALVSPDGRTQAHSVVLGNASPVIAAMLASGMREGERREVCVQEPSRVVELFLRLLYTGCVPPDTSGPLEVPKLQEGMRVTASSAFMSNSAKSTLLPSGLEGDVCSLDSAGDALIKFDGVVNRQWVTRKNFCRLRSSTAEGIARLQRDLAGAVALAERWQVSGLTEVLAERLERSISAECLEAVLEVAVLHHGSAALARLRGACLALAQHSSTVRGAYEAGAYSTNVLSALRPVFNGGGLKRPRDSL